MRERASRRKQMHNLGTARDQPVRDVEAVAIGRVTLGMMQTLSAPAAKACAASRKRAVFMCSW